MYAASNIAPPHAPCLIKLTKMIAVVLPVAIRYLVTSVIANSKTTNRQHTDNKVGTSSPKRKKNNAYRIGRPRNVLIKNTIQ